MFDVDLATLYGVETKMLKRVVRRNINRFPHDFMFEVTPKEFNDLRCQNGTSSWGGTRYNAFAFTELGVAMLSSVLNSLAAIEVNIRIMRAFVEMRHFAQLAANDYSELRKEINSIKDYIEDILEDQNDINEDHRAQLDAISMALAEMQAAKPTEKRRRIGFIQED